MVVVGIDPGTATTGYGFVKQNAQGGLEAVDFGAILTPPSQSPEGRLLVIYQRLKELFLLHQPESGAVEKLFFQKNVKTAISVSQARGVALLALAEQGLKAYEYAPVEVKQAIAGYGAADKGQVQQMVRALLNLPSIPQPDDAADALAIAICHLHSRRYQELR